MKNLLRAFALAGILVGFSAAPVHAGSGTSSSTSHAVVADRPSGIYAVAQKSFAESITPVADVVIASESGIQLVTITATSGRCRAVLFDASGELLRSRAVDDEIDIDFWSMPNGTYRLTILDASGALQMEQTLVKR